MTTSTVFGLPYLASQQATPEILHNEALYMLEALLHGVKAIQNAPPGGPADGDTYIVGTAGSGAWLGKNNCVATYVSNAWRFVPGFNTLGAQIAMGTPQEGLQVYNQALDTQYRWTGAAWVTAGSITPDNSLALSKLINATAQGSFINRRTAGAGAWEESTLAQTKTLLALTGADVANTPAGGIAATTVQAAINELDTEKYTPAANTLPLADFANAGAQYDIIGRKTAAGGAWEDCTRAQLLLATLDQIQTFTARNAFNTPQVDFGWAGGSTYGSPAATFVKTAAGTQAYVANFINASSSVNTQVTLGMTPNTNIPLVELTAKRTSAGGNTQFQVWCYDGSTLVKRAEFDSGANVFFGITYCDKVFAPGGYTVATLPAAATVPGGIAYVTDSTVAAGGNWGAVVAGGGANYVPVRASASTWYIG